ncbi:MAG TPA: hypothetical protein VGV37_09095 [Aliidongia sp.]|uniref:hypothetical protein n=1 Tax=Aliidongia sp. TaxID=1914230 RepID=UPI002DDDBA27|nr:hypothetical protein [Aliidongia sp.]HEV2674685.1 hypothetical protein [Aliidongia sp.]
MRCRHFALPLLALSLVGCGSAPPPPQPVVGPGVGGISRSYNLVDDQGRIAGRVVISPLGGGQLIDQNGNVVGRFVQQ